MSDELLKYIPENITPKRYETIEDLIAGRPINEQTHIEKEERTERMNDAAPMTEEALAKAKQLASVLIDTGLILHRMAMDALIDEVHRLKDHAKKYWESRKPIGALDELKDAMKVLDDFKFEEETARLVTNIIFRSKQCILEVLDTKPLSNERDEASEKLKKIIQAQLYPMFRVVKGESNE